MRIFLLALAVMILVSAPATARATEEECLDSIEALDFSGEGGRIIASDFGDWPAEHTLAVADDVTVYYTFPGPAPIWGEGALISVNSGISNVELGAAGEVTLTHYFSVDACMRIQQILGDESIMSQIRALIPWDTRPTDATP